MADLHTIKASLAGGEIAPSLYSRVDLALYPKAAKLLKNFFVHPHGGISNRTGSVYQATAKYDNKDITLFPFEYSTLQNYILEFGDLYARFFTNLGGTSGQIVTSEYALDSFTKMLIHFDKTSGSKLFTEENSKTVINSEVELDYMEYATNILAQSTYITNAIPTEVVDQLQIQETDSTALGNSSGNEIRAAQSFKLSGTQIITSVEIKHGADSNSPTGNWTLRIETDNGGVPSGTLANVNASVVVTPPAVNTIIKGTFSAPFYLTGGITYHLVILCDTQSNDYYWNLLFKNSDIYANGHRSYSLNGGTSWLADNTSDLYFKIYIADTFSLQSYSESTIKYQGSYSLKVVAAITDSLNKKLTRTISSPINLSDKNSISFDIYSSRTGANIKIGIHDSGGTTTEKTYTIVTANTKETVTWDISAVANADKDAIDSIIITIVNADAANTFYIDNLFGGTSVISDVSIKKIGTASAYFDGYSYLTLSNSVDFNPESTDFTYETFISFETLSDSWICGNGALTAGGWGLKYDNTGHTLAFWANGSSRASVTFTPSTNTFYHIEVDRHLGIITLAIDGIFGSGSVYTAAITSIYNFTLGSDSQVTTGFFNGWQDEARWSKGVARHTSNFTPPSETSIPYEIVTPYADTQLAYINYTQSADVMYLAHPDFAPRELTRFDNTNWTLSLYDYVGGPFMLANTDTTMTLASSATALGASTTLTATGFTFQSGHVASLWQLEHYIEGQIATSAFTSSTTGTAIKCGGTWRLITHGTWTGKVSVEKSSDGSTGWTKLREFTSADDYNENTYGTEDMSNNEEPFFVRLNMSSYTSGTCNADLTTDAFYQRGIAKIDTVAVGGATATATIKRSIGLTTATIDWSEGAWSDYRGWPAVVEFSPEDRLIWANTKTQPQTHWDSKTGEYNNFSRGDPLTDADGITVNLPARKVNGITSIVPLSTIIALTSSSEWGILSSDGSVITPTSIKHKIYGYEGSSGIRPVVIGNRAIYVQIMSSIIRDLGYELYSESFTGADISILANHLFTGYTIQDMTYAQNPDRLVWCVRSDGKMLTLTFMREQEILAWTWHDTNNGTDLYKSVASIPNATYNYNEVWVAVQRGTKRYIERFAQRLASTLPEEQIFLDSAITYRGAATNNVTGLDHLNGYTVGILADGNVMSRQVVSGGTLPTNLPGNYSVIHVGIPYNSDFESLNVEVNLPDGTLQGRKVKISDIILRVSNSRGGYIGPDSSTLHPISNSPMAGPTVSTYDATGVLTLNTGEIKENLGAGYEDGGRIFFRQSDPLPFTLFAIIPIVRVAGVQ